MVILNKATLLAVGLGSQATVLGELPARLLRTETGCEAIRKLREEFVDMIIAKWDLPDMSDGEFVKRVCWAKPSIPITVVMNTEDKAREISARQLGVTAILPEPVEALPLVHIVEQMLSKIHKSAEKQEAFKEVHGIVQVNDRITSTITLNQ